MKLGKQVYSAPTNGSKTIQIQYNGDEARNGFALNFTGYAYLDRKYFLVQQILSQGMHKVVVTNQDLIGCDDYIALLPNGITVVFVHEGKSKFTNSAFGTCGASKLRLRAAQAKLKTAGIKTKFFASEQTCLKYLEGCAS